MIIRKPSKITGLDMGSSKISAVASEIDRAGQFRVVAQVTHASKGVSRGAITDLDGATDAASKALRTLREKISQDPGDIYVNISGRDVKGSLSKGMIPISLRGREVTRSDIRRCIDAAATISLPFGREIIHTIARNFIVDDQRPVKDPLGLYASRLSCEVYILTADSNHIQNIYKCVNSAGYDVREVVFTAIADAASLLEEDEEEEGIALIDLGSSLTQVSVFCDGAILDIDMIEVGASDVGGDFRESPEFNGLVSKTGAYLSDLSDRMGRKLPVTLTGGMALTDGVVEFFEEKLSRPVKMGMAKDIRGDISGPDSVRLPTAIGLAKYAYENYSKRLAEEKNLVKGLSAKVVDIFNNYF
jgi:cell division ATPase FtsA